MHKSVIATAFLILSSITGGLLSFMVSAETKYPTQPLRAIVPYSPGVTADLIARSLGPHVSKNWNIPFVVENRPGASSIIGVKAVIGAPPDGHTLLFIAENLASAASVYNKTYDPVNDLEPVILLARGDYALITTASFPAKTVAELIAMARERPGTINYASPGKGVPAHLMMELFKSTAGINLVHVSYKGNAGAVTDTISGQVSLMFASMAVAHPLARAGRVRILAAGGVKRTSLMPEVPSLTEAGIRDFNVGNWYAVLVPKNTPQDVKTKLNSELGALLKLESVAELMRKQGVAVSGGTPEELHEQIRGDFERWNKVVREAKITAD